MENRPRPAQRRLALDAERERHLAAQFWHLGEIVSELRKLNPEDPDSFLILEQRDPRNAQNYWFIQSAVNRAGPRPGWYTVEVGWGSQRGKELRDLDVQTVEEVIPFFQAAYNRKAVDLSGFTDMSSLLG